MLECWHSGKVCMSSEEEVDVSTSLCEDSKAR